MARLQNSFPLSVLIALGRPLVLASCSRIRTSWLPPSARTILAIASVMSGNYLQRKKPSAFGRLYYEGVSVQNINKELRRAVLGNCWEYDIRSSVVAWKMVSVRRTHLAC